MSRAIGGEPRGGQLQVCRETSIDAYSCVLAGHGLKLRRWGKPASRIECNGNAAS